MAMSWGFLTFSTLATGTGQLGGGGGVKNVYLDKVDRVQGFQLRPLLLGHFRVQDDQGGGHGVAFADLLGKAEEALGSAADDDMVAQVA